MTTILILEGQSPELVCNGHSYVAEFATCLMAIDPGLTIVGKNPYVQPIQAADFDGVDGVVFTGSGVAWNTSDPRGQAQVDAMRVAFKTGLPIWGSCNGFQLMASVLGGQVGESPNGYEGGLAKNLQLTEAGKTHPMMRGRKDGDAVPCIHRDEIQALPEGAVLLAGNAHSPVQAAVYEKDGIDYWGAQYHPELTPAFIAATLGRKDTGEFADTIAELKALDDDPGYTTELRNWLLNVRARKIAKNTEIAAVKQRYAGAETFEFGDNRMLSDLLIRLVRGGKKRATCGALRDFHEGGEAMPVVGREDICLDWDGNPALVIRTVEVTVRKFKDVDADFALAEGENETLEGWQNDHRGYFERNGGWSEDMELVCERFEVIEDLGAGIKG